ncbi:DUF6715 family protein [Butyrivibrio sp. MC2021]|uniref:DUF6715 family protein n=1 Tax=Butyrivibrio sp. MC2021 TaxID=1408306 RepID=UPI0004797592|nr:DUF6715 family protein [Butyrivibrio sp. MC2021]
MEKNGVGSAVAKSIVLVLLGAMVVLGLFFLFNRKKDSSGGEENYKLSAVDTITTTNLDKTYPADPRKVVELYCQIIKVLYNEKYTVEQEKAMLDVLAGILDDELLANQTNFYAAMSNEAQSRRNEGYSFSTYQVNSSTPEEIIINDRKCCEVECYYSLMKGSTRESMYYTFLLRKDDQKRWKIAYYGPTQN